MMEKRPVGRTGDSSAILGNVRMRLSLAWPAPDGIGSYLAERMVRSAIYRGVDYVETACPCHGTGERMTSGKSGPFLDKAHKGGCREKAKPAARHRAWEPEKFADFRSCLDGRLVRLDARQIDCRLVRSLNRGAGPP
jgi:predicted aldo/keto reductase-like oxidoreductase